MKISHDFIRIDREKKEVVIRNNYRLYNFIESGSALSFFPVYHALESMKSLAESVDPSLTLIVDFFVKVLEALYLYEISNWKLGFSRRVGLQTELITLSPTE